MYVFSEDWIDQRKVRDSSPVLLVQIDDAPMPISDEFVYEIFSRFGLVQRIGVSAESFFRFLVKFESPCCAILAKWDLHGQRLDEDYEDYGVFDIKYFHHVMEANEELPEIHVEDATKNEGWIDDELEECDDGWDSKGTKDDVGSTLSEPGTTLGNEDEIDSSKQVGDEGLVFDWTVPKSVIPSSSNVYDEDSWNLKAVITDKEDSKEFDLSSESSILNNEVVDDDDWVEEEDANTRNSAVNTKDDEAVDDDVWAKEEDANTRNYVVDTKEELVDTRTLIDTHQTDRELEFKTIRQQFQVVTHAYKSTNEGDMRVFSMLSTRFQVHSNSSGGSISKRRKRTTEDDSDANNTEVLIANNLEQAKAIQFSLPPECPTLLRSMHQSHVSGGYWLGFPREFCKLYLSRKDTTILLEDEEGKEYETKYHYNWEKSGLSTGWKQFTKAHDLVVGDVLVFQALGPTKLKVYIGRSSEAHKSVKSEQTVPEVGQSSNSASPTKFRCEICVQRRHVDDSFQVQGCTHSYCRDCITQYIISKLDQNITWVKCPENCGGYLETEHCRSILPNDVYERWGKALCEALIPAAEKLYCPFKDCSAILIKDGNEVVRESECPHCFRLFCAQCESPWHAEMECLEFQELNKDEREREDIMLMKLAEKKKWKRCPSCKFYVQKKDGCLFVKCRCGVEFCYSCGKQPTISHYCMYCRH